MALQLDSYPDIAYGAGSDLDLSIDERRQLWKWEAAVGYRIFAAMRWGQLGDGHITCRDPEHRDHFWMLSYGVPFRQATVHDLILIGPDGSVVDGAINGLAMGVIPWVTRLAGRGQSGYVFHYAFVMLIGVSILVTWLSVGGSAH